MFGELYRVERGRGLIALRHTFRLSFPHLGERGREGDIWKSDESCLSTFLVVFFATSACTDVVAKCWRYTPIRVFPPNSKTVWIWSTRCMEIIEHHICFGQKDESNPQFPSSYDLVRFDARTSSAVTRCTFREAPYFNLNSFILFIYSCFAKWQVCSWCLVTLSCVYHLESSPSLKNGLTKVVR